MFYEYYDASIDCMQSDLRFQFRTSSSDTQTSSLTKLFIKILK